jgi:hypothetical protein
VILYARLNSTNLHPTQNSMNADTHKQCRQETGSILPEGWGNPVAIDCCCAGAMALVGDGTGQRGKIGLEMRCVEGSNRLWNRKLAAAVH